MAQNLKELFKNAAKNDTAKMSEGHEARFLEKLENALPKQKKANRFSFLNIAASVIILLGLIYGMITYFNTPIEPIENDIATTPLKTMGDLSPDLKKVEDFYLASINLELAKVTLTPENKELFDGYLERLKELNEEYDTLTLELNANGLNQEILNAHIDNLKARLNLVMRLNEKLKEFNSDSFSEQHI